ncbi:hypothetical protein [Desulfosediminicola flagellatus]|uniref:hypothetical protein n=1 Tax=Desulfosediminicola flagellatus TaxID=2569541 RepID=UPI0010AC5DF1|nr:hypothetical protein [Desulfosediminicola flagellatus]
MTAFLLLFTITFFIVGTSALIINYSKQRANLTRHGLTGLCHKSAGVMCSSCASQLQSGNEKSTSNA